MSHFTLLVTVDGSTKQADIQSKVSELLEPFNESTEVAPYIRNTKQQLIDSERKEILDYANTGLYSEYLKDPAAYIKTIRNNRGHLRYLGVPDQELPALPSFEKQEFETFWEKLEREDAEKEAQREAESKAPATEREKLLNLTFPEKLAGVEDDEFVFKLAALWHEAYGEEDEDGNVRTSGIDSEGNEWSTYNPKSQWDWWSIGGRWDGMLNNTAGQKAEKYNGSNILRNRDLRRPESTFAYLTKDGVWNEKGQMGWFGMSSNEKDQEVWDKQMAEYLLATPGEDWLVVVDCHI